MCFVVGCVDWLLQEKDKLAGNVPCKWPWFEALDELIGGSPKQSRVGSARKQARFSSSPSPRPPGGLPTPYFGGSFVSLMFAASCIWKFQFCGSCSVFGDVFGFVEHLLWERGD